MSLLQNEADKEYLLRDEKLKKHEKTIMSEVPGWEVGKSQYYNSSRWTPDHLMDSMKSNMKK